MLEKYTAHTVHVSVITLNALKEVHSTFVYVDYIKQTGVLFFCYEFKIILTLQTYPFPKNTSG